MLGKHKQIVCRHVILSRQIFDGVQQRRIFYECRNLRIIFSRRRDGGYDRVFIHASGNRRDMAPVIQIDGVVI